MKKLFAFWQLLLVAALTILNIVISLDLDGWYRSTLSAVVPSNHCYGKGHYTAFSDLPIQLPKPQGSSVRSVPISSNMTVETVRLPQWIKDYFAWHGRRLAEIEEKNLPWSREKVLISRCLHGDVCGCTADRLRTFPTLLAVAASTRRLLFFRWSRPVSLEEFLEGGPLMNWTIPSGLDKELEHRGERPAHRSKSTLLQEASDSHQWVVEGSL